MGLLRGPPTANGPPGSHHVLSRVFKDIYPRFQTMRGYRVERKGGWDCHGLPVEIAVEQKLGITTKDEIEDLRHRELQRRVPRLGVRVPGGVGPPDRTHRLLAGPRERLPDAGRDLHRVGLVGAREIHARGLLYEGHKVVPYCPRCETTLSSHEVAQGYQRRGRPVRLPEAARRAGSGRSPAGLDDDAVDAPRNVAVAVSPSATYARVRSGDETLVLAEARVEAVLGEGAEVLERFTGAELVARYAGLSRARSSRRATGSPARAVLADEFVTTDDGTGLVHLAPAFGEDDYRVPRPPRVRFDPRSRDALNPVARRHLRRARARPHGRLLRGPGRQGRGRHARADRGPARGRPAAAGRGLRARLPALLALGQPAHLLRQTVLVHRDLDAARPSCWAPTRRSTGTPRTSSTAASATGSRTTSTGRSRASATGARRCRCGAAAGARARGRLVRRARRALGRELDDHHRPYVDEVGFRLPRHVRRLGEQMQRVPEVIDVWFDSGAMPFAQHHYPFEDEAVFDPVPGRLHLRGAGPDAGLVLLAARRVDAARRRRAVPQRCLPRA